MYVGRTHNGTYHITNGNAAPCNSRSMNLRVVDISTIERASEAMFCKKCFSSKRFDSRKEAAINMMSA